MFSVLKVSGSALKSDQLYDNIARLYDAGNITPIIYGWGSALTEKLNSSGLGTEIHESGVRITKAKDLPLLEEIAMEHAGMISTKLEEKGIRSRLLYKIIKAQMKPLEGVSEKHYTGEYVQADTRRIMDCTKEGIIPLIPPLGYNGSLLNINADNVATGLVLDLKPDSYILCTNSGGVVRDGKIMDTLSIANDNGNYISHGMRLKINELRKVAGKSEIIIASPDTFQGTYVVA